MAFLTENAQKHLANRHRKSRLFALLCAIVTWSSVFLLGVLLVRITLDGIGWLNWNFLTSFPSRFPAQAGIKSALAGTLWLIVMIAFISIPPTPQM